MNKYIIYIPHKDSHPAYSLFYNKSPKNLKIVFNELNSADNFNKFKKNNGKFHEIYYKKLSGINKIFNLLTDLLFKILNFFNLPVVYPILPTNKFQYDFVLNNGLVLSFKKYICYIEYIGSLVNFNDNILNSRLNIKIIKNLLLSKRCIYVFVWSKAAKKILINFFNIPKNKVSKFKTIYPTIEPKDIFAKKNEKTKLLFISSIAHVDKEFNFFMKGGKLILQAFKELNSKLNNMELTFIGYVPPKFKKIFKNNQNIKFYLQLPYDQILKLYEISDIFLFPSYADSFGFTFLEAMSYGLPIICLNNNSAAPELVINNKTGFVLETSQRFLYFPYSKYCPDWITKKIYYHNLRKKDDLIGLKNLIEKLEILIQNKELREKFGKNGRERIKNGKLSIKHRNKKLFNLFMGI